MAKPQEKRFIRVYSQGYSEILVDRETGVNYLFHESEYGAGLTPLLDADGKVLVTPIDENSEL